MQRTWVDSMEYLTEIWKILSFWHSGERSKRFQGMFKKNLENVLGDSSERSGTLQGMLKKISGIVWEDSRKCSRRFGGMFKKIQDNALNFKSIKATNKKNVISLLEAWIIFTISNEIWKDDLIFSFHLEFKLKRICYDHAKRKSFEDKRKIHEDKLKIKTNRRRKCIKEIKETFVYDLIYSSFRKNWKSF